MITSAQRSSKTSPPRLSLTGGGGGSRQRWEAIDATLDVRQEEVGNLLLASLPPEEFRQLAPGLARVGLEAGARLYEPGEVVPFIHFAEGGLLSLLAPLEDGASVEVGALGREGLGGLFVLLGADVAAHAALVRVGAGALRIGTTQARECFECLPAFRSRVLRYSRLLASQVSQTTLCNTLHTIEQRLARWLLLARMRLGADTVPVTHASLSHTLGVRRSGVTVAVGRPGAGRAPHARERLRARGGCAGTGGRRVRVSRPAG